MLSNALLPTINFHISPSWFRISPFWHRECHPINKIHDCLCRILNILRRASLIYILTSILFLPILCSRTLCPCYNRRGYFYRLISSTFLPSISGRHRSHIKSSSIYSPFVQKLNSSWLSSKPLESSFKASWLLSPVLLSLSPKSLLGALGLSPKSLLGLSPSHFLGLSVCPQSHFSVCPSHFLSSEIHLLFLAKLYRQWLISK